MKSPGKSCFPPPSGQDKRDRASGSSGLLSAGVLFLGGVLLSSGILLLGGCASAPETAPEFPAGSSAQYQDSSGAALTAPQAEPATPSQAQVLQSAHSLLGKAPGQYVHVNSRRFRLDCIGTVGAIFYGAGIDINRDLGPQAGGAGSGVTVLYHILRAQEALHQKNLPEIGDVIFWQNTYDRNGDGRIGNDGITHVGIVVKVEKDGTIHYLHENMLTGVVVERMNLYRPKVHRHPETGKLLNSPMFANSYQGNPNNPERWLAGDLWTAFGGVLSLAGRNNKAPAVP